MSAVTNSSLQDSLYFMGLQRTPHFFPLRDAVSPTNAGEFILNPDHSTSISDKIVNGICTCRKNLTSLTPLNRVPMWVWSFAPLISLISFLELRREYAGN
jgi:hypothetical protein